MTTAAAPAGNASATIAADGETSLGTEGFRAIDRISDAMVAQWSSGLSPASLTLAFLDWWFHLAAAPGKRAELTAKGARKAARLATHVMSSLQGSAQPCIEPLPGDNRFTAPDWQKPPFSIWAQSFLLTQQWWHNVTHEVPGVMPHHEHVVSFSARQLLDIFSPSNHPLTNPEVIAKTLESGGTNFFQGWRNFIEDLTRLTAHQPPVGTESFIPGETVAVTPGKVVYRNRLIELIQYSPTTETVRAEPILIVPAWIMKYYILDLSPGNSLVRYLVEQGYTVFCISWRNPDVDDRNLAMEDYRRLGVMAALDAVSAIVPGCKVHATGYCIGGTLLAIAAAAMGRAGDDRLASATFLAAQIDFTEPGELALFIDDSEMNFLSSVMWNRGYLSADQMAGAFQLLRSNDLIWSRNVREYLMGERTPMIDLMAWNADSTRMPYRMHSEYLRRLYLNNELAAGSFLVNDRPAVPQNIRVPVFSVSTERDHVAPWRSVYKVHQLTDTDVTFVLTNGGHNAGIVSEPGHRGRHFRVGTKHATDLDVSADEWLMSAEQKQGSWWTEWTQWLGTHSSPQLVPAPSVGASEKGYPVLLDAPGTYVFQK